VDHSLVAGHVREALLEVDLLPVAGTEQLRLLHAGDGQGGLVVELASLETIEQVDAGPEVARQTPTRSVTLA